MFQQNLLRKADINLWMIDGNDEGAQGSGRAEDCTLSKYGKSFFGKTCEQVGLTCYTLNKDGRIYAQLTTPVSYMSSIPMDPFTNGLFYTYGTSHCPNGDLGAYWCFIACGPDKDEGDVSWLIANGVSIPYSPSNGLVSNGDVWMSYKLKNQTDRSYDVAFGSMGNSF